MEWKENLRIRAGMEPVAGKCGKERIRGSLTVQMQVLEKKRELFLLPPPYPSLLINACYNSVKTKFMKTVFSWLKCKQATQSAERLL